MVTNKDVEGLNTYVAFCKQTVSANKPTSNPTSQPVYANIDACGPKRIAMPPFAFIDCGEQGKVSKDDDWIIRSHCMLGKNKRSKTRRRVPKDKVRAQAPSKRVNRPKPITTLVYQSALHTPVYLDINPTMYLPYAVDPESWHHLWRCKF